MAYPLIEQKATGEQKAAGAHTEIDNLISMDVLKQWWDSVKGKNILGQEVSPPSQIELLEMIMPFAGSIRGGKTAISTLQQLRGIAKKYGIKTPKKLHPQTIESYMTSNEVNLARMKNQQLLKKHGIADPDKKGMVDPVTALLNYFSKN